MATIYLIRHSAPFVEIDNYQDYKNVSWPEYNKNIRLSGVGEDIAKQLSDVEELQRVDEIYASNSFRAIGTAKYIAEKNNIKIKLDPRINEREFGVDRISDLPDDFTKLSFDDKSFKVNNGESLNEVDERFNSFINFILSKNNKKTIVVLHGIILLSFLKSICSTFDFDGRNFDIKFNDKVILNGAPKNPEIYKIEYNEDKNVINIVNVKTTNK